MITPIDLSLKSKNVGRVLLAFLWCNLFFGVMSVVFSLLEMGWPSFYQPLELLDILQGIVGLVVFLFTVIVFLIWMYFLHHDLKQVFNDYPISPKGALARLMIPLYNLWGTWNVFSTMAHYLSEQLRTWLSVMYGIAVVSRALGRLIARESLDGEALLIVTVITAIADVALYAVWLRMTMIITNDVDYHAEKAQLKQLGMRDLSQ